MTTDDRGERPAADKDALQRAVHESTAAADAAVAGEPIVNADPPAGKKAAAKKAPVAKKAAAVFFGAVDFAARLGVFFVGAVAGASIAGSVPWSSVVIVSPSSGVGAGSGALGASVRAGQPVQGRERDHQPVRSVACLVDALVNRLVGLERPQEG